MSCDIHKVVVWLKYTFLCCHCLKKPTYYRRQHKVSKIGSASVFVLDSKIFIICSSYKIRGSGWYRTRDTWIRAIRALNSRSDLLLCYSLKVNKQLLYFNCNLVFCPLLKYFWTCTVLFPVPSAGWGTRCERKNKGKIAPVLN
jgi:hypothetical protein